MTRGKRRNGITLSGRATAKRTDEIEVSGSECVAIDALAASGRITVLQHRAARYFIRDARSKPGRMEAALEEAQPKHHGPLKQILIDGKTPAQYGKAIMGWRNPVECETWGLVQLRKALDDIGEVYRGRKRKGTAPFPGFGDVDDEDDGE